MDPRGGETFAKGKLFDASISVYATTIYSQVIAAIIAWMNYDQLGDHLMQQSVRGQSTHELSASSSKVLKCDGTFAGDTFPTQWKRGAFTCKGVR